MRKHYVNFGIMIALLALALLASLNDSPFLVTLMTRVVILALAGVGLNIALGYGGLVSFGHAAFWGLGGYVTGILAHHAQTYTPLFEGSLNLPGTQMMPVVWLVTLVVCAVMAFIIGFLSLRTTGVYFIMVTLAFAQMLFYFSISWPAYGGEDGLSIYMRGTFFGLDMSQPWPFFLVCYGILVLAVFFTSRLHDSPFGLMLNAVRQSEPRVETVGVKTFKVKLTAFVISGMMTGLAGALFADLNRFVSPEMFHWQVSGEIMVFVILGGVARLVGPVVGAAVFTLLEHLLGDVSDYWHLYLGVLLLLIVLYAKGGIIGVLSGKKVQHD